MKCAKCNTKIDTADYESLVDGFWVNQEFVCWKCFQELTEAERQFALEGVYEDPSF